MVGKELATQRKVEGTRVTKIECIIVSISKSGVNAEEEEKALC